jgi:hypothetical protein
MTSVHWTPPSVAASVLPWPGSGRLAEELRAALTAEGLAHIADVLAAAPGVATPHVQ